MTAVWALWHGGGSYAAPYLDDHLERFDSIDDALAECESRYWNRDGSTPAVDDASVMWVYFADPTGSDDPYPDKLIQRGRRGYRVMPA